MITFIFVTEKRITLFKSRKRFSSVGMYEVQNPPFWKFRQEFFWKPTEYCIF